MENFCLIRTPKTGTTSFIQSITDQTDLTRSQCFSKEHWPAEHFLQHGHDHDYVTFVREPLQIYVSNYHFLLARRETILQRRQIPDNRNASFHNASGFQDLMRHFDLIDAGASLEDYLLSAPENDFLFKYQAGLEPKDFFFVGVVEDMEASYALFNELASVNLLPPPRLNYNPQNATRRGYAVPPDVEQKFRARNEGEYDTYYGCVEHWRVARNA